METADGWRKSSYSGANGGECVEVATTAEAVLVRDSKDNSGDMLSVSSSAWSAFISAIK
jgi:Domain of unknown function (DUF397)